MQQINLIKQQKAIITWGYYTGLCIYTYSEYFSIIRNGIAIPKFVLFPAGILVYVDNTVRQ